MARYKTSFIFDLCGCGWTETIYFQQPNRASAELAAQAIAEARSIMLGRPASLVAARIHDLSTPRDCAIVTYGAMAVQPLNADVAWNGWLVNLQADPHCRRYLMRGVPDVWIERDQDDFCKYPKPSDFVLLLNTWCQILSLANAEVRGVTPESLANPAIPITGISDNPLTGNLVFGVAGVIGTTGDTIRIKGWTGVDARALNGVFTIVENTGGSVEVKYKYGRLANPGANFPGAAVSQVYDFYPITDCKLSKPSRRPAGRPFGVCHGRRSFRR